MQKGDSPAFWSDLALYAVLAVTTGAFGAARNLCVSIVGRRISRDVRAQLFSAILVQDM